MKSLFPLSTLLFYTEPRIAPLVEGRSWDVSKSPLAPKQWMDSRHPPSLGFGDVEHARQTALHPIGVLLLRGGSDGSGDRPHKRRRRKKRPDIPGSVEKIETDADSTDGRDDDSRDDIGGATTESKTRKKRIQRRVVETESESTIETPAKKRKKRKRKGSQVEDDTTQEANRPSDPMESNLPNNDKPRTSRKRRTRTGSDRGPNPDVNEDDRLELEATVETATGMRNKSWSSEATATASDVNGPGEKEGDDSTETTGGKRKKRRRRKTLTPSADEGPVAEVTDGLDGVDGTLETDEEETVPEIDDATETSGNSSEQVIRSKRKKRRRKISANEHSDDTKLVSVEASVDIPTEEIVPESIDAAIELDDSLSPSDESIGRPASLEQLSVNVSLDEEESVLGENSVSEETIEHAEPTLARGLSDEEPPSLVIEKSVELPGEEVVPESIDAEVEIQDNIPIAPLDQYSKVEVPDEISVASQDPNEDKTAGELLDKDESSTHSSSDGDESYGDDGEPINDTEDHVAVSIVPETEVEETSTVVENAQEDLSEFDIEVDDGKEVVADAGMQSETGSVAESRSSETVYDESDCEDNGVIEKTSDEALDNDQTISPMGGDTEATESYEDIPEEDPTESVSETAEIEGSVDKKIAGKLPDDSDPNTSEEAVSTTDQDRLKMADDCLRLSVVTWNLAEKAPPEEDAAFFRRFRKDSEGEGSDLVLIGAQECEEIKPRRAEGHRSRHLRRLGIMMLGKDYVPLAIHSLGGIQCALYCHRDRLGDVEMINIADVTCGVGNVLHNKGAVGLFLKMKCNSSDRASRILLVTGHLAAHVKNVDARNADFHRIVSELEAQAPARFLRPKTNRDGSPAECDGSRLLDSMDHVFFAGDLNYRVDLPREHVEKCIVDMKRSPSCRGKIMRKLLRRDQLMQTIASGQAFAGFDEGKISFLPTFKFDKGSSDYDTSHKQRVPAWTDRILFRAKQKVEVCEYESVADSMHSDHRPVLGTFRLGWGIETMKKKARKRRRSR